MDWMTMIESRFARVVDMEYFCKTRQEEEIKQVNEIRNQNDQMKTREKKDTKQEETDQLLGADQPLSCQQKNDNTQCRPDSGNDSKSLKIHKEFPEQKTPRPQSCDH